MENHEEKACLCALNRIFGFEPKTALALIEHTGSAREIFSLSARDLELLTGYGRPERTNHISGKIFRVMHAEKSAASGSSSAKNENRSENLRGFR